MPTLNWIGKEAVVKHHKEVPFRLLEPVAAMGIGAWTGHGPGHSPSGSASCARQHTVSFPCAHKFARCLSALRIVH